MSETREHGITPHNIPRARREALTRPPAICIPLDVVVLAVAAPKRYVRELADVIEILPGLGGDLLAQDLPQHRVIQLVVSLHHPRLRQANGTPPVDFISQDTVKTLCTKKKGEILVEGKRGWDPRLAPKLIFDIQLLERNTDSGVV